MPTTLKKDVGNQTVSIKFTDSGTVPMERSTKSTQTNSKYLTTPQNMAILIDEKVVEMLLDALSQLENEEKFFADFDDLRRHEKISLIPQKVVEIHMLEKLPIVGLEYGINNQVAILFGERRHDYTWCMHSVGRLLVYHKSQFSSPIYLASCATKAVFAPQNQVIVATALGEILVTFEGDILWVSNGFHLQYVTSLFWLARNRLLSTGLDGRLVLSKLKTNGSLEILKVSTITMEDLPRALRKANVTKQQAGIVSISGETGAIWELDPKELSIRNIIGYEQEGIEQLIAIENDFIFSTPQGDLKRRRKRAPQQSETLSGIKAKIPFSIKNSQLLIATMETEINGYDLNLAEIVLNQTTNEKFLAYAINNSTNGTLAAVNDNYQLLFYSFSNDL